MEGIGLASVILTIIGGIVTAFGSYVITRTIKTIRLPEDVAELKKKIDRLDRDVRQYIVDFEGRIARIEGHLHLE